MHLISSENIWGEIVTLKRLTILVTSLRSTRLHNRIKKTWKKLIVLLEVLTLISVILVGWSFYEERIAREEERLARSIERQDREESRLIQSWEILNNNTGPNFSRFNSLNYVIRSLAKSEGYGTAPWIIDADISNLSVFHKESNLETAHFICSSFENSVFEISGAQQITAQHNNFDDFYFYVNSGEKVIVEISRSSMVKSNFTIINGIFYISNSDLRGSKIELKSVNEVGFWGNLLLQRDVSPQQGIAVTTDSLHSLH